MCGDTRLIRLSDMQLTEHRNERQLFVRHVDATSITVIDRRLETSVVLSSNEAIENFQVRRVEDLDQTAIEKILAFNPAVVILGTGSRAVFAAPRVQAEFLKRGIGLETMDNAAAARTFNVLIGEGRNAVGVFLFPA
jgi:uncharacterized protein